MTKTLHVLASIAPEKGGPSTAVRAVAQAQAEQGDEVWVSANSEDSQGSVEVADGYTILRHGLTVPRLQYSASAHRWLVQNVRDFDLVVIHSLFLPHVQVAARIARRHHVRYVMRPHGSLTRNDLAHHGGRKRLYLRLFERSLLDDASAVWCTSNQEETDAQALGLGNTRLIPLGVSPPALTDLPDARTVKPIRSQFLFLGRIASKKRVDLAIEALAVLRDRGLNARLRVVGPDHDGLVPGLSELARRQRVADAVDWVGHASGGSREEAFATSVAFILPSEGENFGIATAEALYRGIPVILSRFVSHAPGVEQHGAGLICDLDPTSIADAMQAVMEMGDAELAVMRKRAAQLGRTFSWATTARLLSQVASHSGGSQ